MADVVGYFYRYCGLWSDCSSATSCFRISQHCPCTLDGVCVVCPGTSELVCQHLRSTALRLVSSTPSWSSSKMANTASPASSLPPEMFGITIVSHDNGRFFGNVDDEWDTCLHFQMMLNGSSNHYCLCYCKHDPTT